MSSQANSPRYVCHITKWVLRYREYFVLQCWPWSFRISDDHRSSLRAMLFLSQPTLSIKRSPSALPSLHNGGCSRRFLWLANQQTSGILGECRDSPFDRENNGNEHLVSSPISSTEDFPHATTSTHTIWPQYNCDGTGHSQGNISTPHKAQIGRASCRE